MLPLCRILNTLTGLKASFNLFIFYNIYFKFWINVDLFIHFYVHTSRKGLIKKLLMYIIVKQYAYMENYILFKTFSTWLTFLSSLITAYTQRGQTFNEIPILNKTLFHNTQISLRSLFTGSHLLHLSISSSPCSSSLLMLCSSVTSISCLGFLPSFLFSLSKKHLVGSLLAKIIPGTITAEPLRRAKSGPKINFINWKVHKFLIKKIDKNAKIS